MSAAETQKPLYTAVYKVLRALARTLLRNGVPYTAFSEIARRAFVDVALKEFQLPGKKPTASRAATITGLSRKEVKRLSLISDEDERDMVARYNRAARVVYGWVHDKAYADETGQAAVLPFDRGAVSFSSLVKQYSGDVPPRAILDELIQVGIVERDNDGGIRLLERAYIPTRSQAEKLAILGRDVTGLIATIDSNIHKVRKQPMFQRKVFYDNLPEEALNTLQSLLAERGQTMLEFFDQWMAQHDRDANPAAGGTGRKAAGVGIYYFEEDVVGESVK